MTFERAKSIGDLIVAGLLVTLSLVGHLALSSLDAGTNRKPHPKGAAAVAIQGALLQPEASAASPLPLFRPWSSV